MRRIVLSVLVVSLIGSVWFVKLSIPSAEQLENKKYNVDSYNDLPKREITLLEAYSLGSEVAKKYDGKSELIYLNSVNDSKVSGFDGKRADWQGILSLPTKERRLLFGITDGNLKVYEIIDGSQELTIGDSQLKVDSDLIVENAIKEFKLEPGAKDDPFSNGYHFRIMIAENGIFLAVNGQIRGKGVEIYYNPQNGTYMGRTEDVSYKFN